MHAEEHRVIAHRIAGRLLRPLHRGYAQGKLRFDPAYAAVAALLAGDDSDLLDVGCGLGLLGFYLRERGFCGAYRGVDLDLPKIAEARRVAGEHYADLVFDHGSAGELPPFGGHVALLDVLHYLERADQQLLLREAAARVAPGAMLIVRNVLRAPGWRFQATVWEERFIYGVGWIRSGARHFPCREEIETPLRAAGFNIDTRPLWGRTPFNSFLIVARRAGAPGVA